MPARAVSSTLRAQRGAAALLATMMLLALVLLALAYTSRGLLAEQRASVNQYRAAQALGAAEAGIEWTVALLNSGKVDDRCRRDDRGTIFVDRYLRIDAADDGQISLAPAGTSAAPACMLLGGQWECRCANVAALPAAPADSAPHPFFRTTFEPLPGAGRIKLSSLGCAHAALACDEAAPISSAQSRSSVSVDVALVPALRRLPAAALTARGAINVPGDTLKVQNASRAGSGLTLHAGGPIDAAQAQLTSFPGTPANASVLANDSTLAIDSERFFATFFGLDRASYRGLPTVHALPCAADCSGALQQAVARGHRTFWIDGELRLGPGTFGSPDDPLLLLAEGPVHFAGPLQLHGVLLARADASARWSSSGSDVQVRGALIADGDLQGPLALDLVYDHAVLQRLHLARGTFAKLPGSWRDFR